MKKSILIIGVLTLFITNAIAQTCNECSPSYPLTGTNAIALADLSVESMSVNCDGGKCTAQITVKNLQDDTGAQTQLIVTMPVETTFISAAGEGTTNKVCGNTVTFCLGDINPGISKTVTVVTSEITNTFWKKHESFGAYVYSQVPDMCPKNNFKFWLNNKIGDNCRQFKNNARNTD
ncbi:MAG TPA: hypothetical protein PKN75_07235 [Bacteroidia bacterium]|nr:hypothetical protein [Bacteroidia bacterium]HNU33370.1 hypothetical protein [Bacteroidia bacterium]